MNSFRRRATWKLRVSIYTLFRWHFVNLLYCNMYLYIRYQTIYLQGLVCKFHVTLRGGNNKWWLFLSWKRLGILEGLEINFIQFYSIIIIIFLKFCSWSSIIFKFLREDLFIVSWIDKSPWNSEEWKTNWTAEDNGYVHLTNKLYDFLTTCLLNNYVRSNILAENKVKAHDC